MPAPYSCEEARTARLAEIQDIYPPNSHDDGSKWEQQALRVLQLEEALARPRGNLSGPQAKEWIDDTLENRRVVRDMELLRKSE